jgi:hypothetical protein
LCNKPTCHFKSYQGAQVDQHIIIPSKQNGGGYDDLPTVTDKVKQKCATSKQEVLKLLALLPKKLDSLHNR